jgi:hypothetical protein
VKIIYDPLCQESNIHQSEKLHSVFTIGKIVQQLCAGKFILKKGQHIIEKCGVGPKYMRRRMPVDIKTEIMNGKQAEK